MNSVQRILLFLLLSCTAMVQAQVSCVTGEVAVEVIITTDGYGYETGWELVDATTLTVYKSVPSGTYASNTTYQDTICVPASACLQFTITDDYGDGIFSPGGYTVNYDGAAAASGAAFGSAAEHYIGCGPGMSCETAIPISEGVHTAPHANYWYSFTPDSVGTYKFSTCGYAFCDTRLWIYEDCDGIDLTAAEEGSLYFNDNDPSCGLQSEIPDAILAPGVTVYLRVGDVGGDCSGSIDFELSYQGPVSGCTDPLACNYNPLATVSDTCIYPGSPDCPDGPDLVILGDEIESSMTVSSLNVSIGDCLVAEECVTGYGDRTLIRFDTYILNQGNRDYYIGNPSDNPDQFETVNCHGHTHYKGYAEYILFDQDGTETPVGFKNGFCVMDIWCPAGGATYGCGTMGITAGCADIYGSGTTCNWIDVTNVDTGTYTFVARTNWDQDPDGLGQHETDYFNNWTQVCLYIGKDAFGNTFFEIDTVCDPYVDCLGEIYGDAQLDCNGDCNGTAIRGDLDVNGMVEVVDVNDYISGIVGEDLLATSCNDLNDDGDISVSDAALLNSCLIYTTGHPHDGYAPHDHCNFPLSLTNIYDTVRFQIADINWDDQYVDIAMWNPYNEVVGFEFIMEGLEILSLESLLDPVNNPFSLDFALGGDRIVGLTYEDSAITKQTGWIPTVRVNWFSLTGSEICIAEIVDVVNGQYEDVLVGLGDDACRPVMTSTGVENVFNPINVTIAPNPTSGSATLQFAAGNHSDWTFEIFSTDGKLVQAWTGLNSYLEFDLSDMPAGLYRYRLTGTEVYSGSLAVTR